jgi:hypothetical protein
MGWLLLNSLLSLGDEHVRVVVRDSRHFVLGLLLLLLLQHAVSALQ